MKRLIAFIFSSALFCAHPTLAGSPGSGSQDGDISSLVARQGPSAPQRTLMSKFADIVNVADNIPTDTADPTAIINGLLTTYAGKATVWIPPTASYTLWADSLAGKFLAQDRRGGHRQEWTERSILHGQPRRPCDD